jgi:hypothetical protein
MSCRPRYWGTGQQPDWSPDGEHIAFIRDYDLYVMRSNGHGLRRLIDAPDQDLERPSSGWSQLGSPCVAAAAALSRVIGSS